MDAVRPEIEIEYSKVAESSTGTLPACTSTGERG